MAALLRAGGSAGEVSGPHLRILSVRGVDKPNSQIEAPSRGLIKAMTKRALATCTSTQHHRCREGIDGGRRPYGLPAVGGGMDRGHQRGSGIDGPLRKPKAFGGSGSGCARPSGGSSWGMGSVALPPERQITYGSIMSLDFEANDRGLPSSCPGRMLGDGRLMEGGRSGRPCASVAPVRKTGPARHTASSSNPATLSEEGPSSGVAVSS